MKKALLLASFLLTFLVFSVRPTFAVTEPTFPSCSTPQGDLRVSYSDGLHGIPGDTNDHQGSDSVYNLSSDTLIQCFCPTNTVDGIQTNWWNVSALSQEDINILVHDGWTFIPDGSLWGLDNAPYVTRNVHFLCAGGIGGGETSGGSSSSGGTGGSVESAAGGIGGGQVLGLAATGGELQLYAVLLLSMASFAGYLFLKKRTSSKKG